jgi:hypothetical protein
MRSSSAAVLVQVYTSVASWERGRLARPGKGLTALRRHSRASSQDGRAPRDCPSSSVEIHQLLGERVGGF